MKTSIRNPKYLYLCGFALSAIIPSCGPGESRHRPEADTPAVTVKEDEEFHADNDIAMTVRSIVDAIRVGEKLDTTYYNFYGILTDGSGRPLYTTTQGHPGMWDVDVLSATSAVVSNEDVGDLLPDDLREYISANLDLSESDIIDSLEYHGAEGAETTVYGFDGGYLRIDVRNSAAANGLEGPLMRITASRDLPSPRN